jgi:aminoglycoside phosphotransferase (APT) family kinase protein
MMTLSAGATAWIEQQLKGRVVNVDQQARWRPHYFVTLDRSGETITVLARGVRTPDAVERSRILSHFSHAREARMIEAIQGHGLKVPKYYGYSDEHRLILMEKLEGTNLLAAAADDAERLSIMKQYFEELAKLHGLDIATMKLGDMYIPKTPEDLAFSGKFRFPREDYLEIRDKVRPDPLMDLGLWWLHNNYPRNARPLSFLQGDTGPGQFMFANGKLCGLIDWEMSHVGDPMLDLGVIRMRNMLYPTGSLREPVAHYVKASGRPMDWHALNFYTVFAMVLSPLAMVESIQRPDASLDDMMARFGFDVTLRRGLCDALAEALGLEIDPPALPDDADDGQSPFQDFLVDHLRLKCAPIAHDKRERMQMEIALATARMTQRDKRVGAILEQANLDDMAKVLGRRPRTINEGNAALVRLIENDAENHLAALVKMFGRIERRKEYLWTPLLYAQESAPFERLAPPAAHGRAA